MSPDIERIYEKNIGAVAAPTKKKTPDTPKR